MQRVFGDGPIDGTDDDVMHLLRTADPAALPSLYVACGTDDFLRPANEWFVDTAESAAWISRPASVPVTTTGSTGIARSRTCWPGSRCEGPDLCQDAMRPPAGAGGLLVLG